MNKLTKKSTNRKKKTDRLKERTTTTAMTTGSGIEARKKIPKSKTIP